MNYIKLFKVKLAGLAVLTVLAIAVGILVFGNTDNKPLRLVAVCTGEGTQVVSGTWIPLEESRRTPEEKTIARRAMKE